MSKPVTPHAAFPQGGQVISMNDLGLPAIVCGATVPTDATAGYGVGCIFIHSDGSGETDVLYKNVGTASSCNFDTIASAGVDLSGVTATAAEINAAADVSGRIVNVTDAATYTVLAADSGKPHIMPNFTASCTLSLPAVSAGLEYEFYGKGVAADAESWIFKSASATNYFLGGVGFVDTDDPADTVVAVYSNGSSNDFLTVAAPGAGTRIKLICDGTNWIANGVVVGATAPAFSDT